MKININSEETVVKIKLNAKGKGRLADKYNYNFIKAHTDKDGYTHLNFREFMRIFGEMLNEQWALPFDEIVEICSTKTTK